MGIEIRAARIDEHPAVGRLTERGFATGAYGPTTNPARLRALHDAAGRAAAGELLVAVDGGDLLGTASLVRAGTAHSREAQDGEAELRLLAVAPEGRGRGVGAALALESLARARDWGMRAVVLDTGPANAASQRLYERLGFVREQQRETTMVDGVGRLVVYRYDFARAGVLVRLVAAHEHDRVAELTVAAYSHDYEISERYRGMLEDVATRAREHQVWVAQDLATGALLGAVTTPRPGSRLSVVAREGELGLRHLAVDPGARGRGIGALLTRHAIDLARERGLRRVVLNSGEHMAPAHRLYARLGFARLPDREERVFEGGLLLAFGIDVPVEAGVPPSQG
ncbi:GNAT family N-acetyltransferase [Cellulomonas chengniuliangii]|uniref:GNAT family N-acetyltransferase n=1 Tax=Cellulomonas chengniuliangii TaxID=2968084 RepID=UPI001D0EA4F8|nr:GNAT family N-acetyltransferase [Cellulomonas chengniuliangii]MCC2318192.1 GNAT family N-acetyltransferase [Cellulomonas chengniuliangii]